MGFEKNSIEIAISNMYANAELYSRIAQAKKLQEYDVELKVALAQEEAWKGAAKLMEEAYRDFIK